MGITLEDVQRGYDRWAAKAHNAKWVRKIDGTPIANDIVVNIFDEVKEIGPELQQDEAEWIKTCTAKISNAIGGGSELFTRHGEEFRLDVDFVCQRIREMRERCHDAMFRAVKAERQPAPPSQGEATSDG